MATPPLPPATDASRRASVYDIGDYGGVKYRIDHRNANTILALDLEDKTRVTVRPETLVGMEPSVKVHGEYNVTWDNVASGNASICTFIGPGQVILAPPIWGDIMPLFIDGSKTWSISKRSFLASSTGLDRRSSPQPILQGVLSGEGIFAVEVTGAGLMFLQSQGAVLDRELAAGEQWIVDPGHLVAWTAEYRLERMQIGSFRPTAATNEGYVCRFTGPGTVYMQTRSPQNLTDWVRAQMPLAERRE